VLINKAKAEDAARKFFGELLSNHELETTIAIAITLDNYGPGWGNFLEPYQEISLVFLDSTKKVLCK